MIWSWFLDLQDLCNCDSIHATDAAALETEIRELIARFDELRRSSPGTPDEAATDPLWNRTFHHILGACLHLAGKHEEAIEVLQFAAAEDPLNLHHVEELVITCLRCGRFDVAAEAVNCLTREQIELEHDSTARKLMRWSGEYPEFLDKLNGEQVKMLVQVIAKYAGDS